MRAGPNSLPGKRSARKMKFPYRRPLRFSTLARAEKSKFRAQRGSFARNAAGGEEERGGGREREREEETASTTVDTRCNQGTYADILPPSLPPTEPHINLLLLVMGDRSVPLVGRDQPSLGSFGTEPKGL